MGKHHNLKIDPEYYMAVGKYGKRFEVRKNDRNYRIGDYVLLQESIDGKLTGREIPIMEITYIIHGGKYGIDKDYCVMQLEFVHEV